MIEPNNWRTRTSQYEPEAFDIVQPGLGAIALVKNEKFALLIAAAPDLLEALKACIQELGWSNYSDEELIDGDYGIRSILVPARAAIAKATGEQP